MAMMLVTFLTLLLIMEAIDSGKIGWEDTVTASEAAAAKGGSQIYLKVGETMTVSDMVKSIAVSSANDCACAMAEHLAGSEAAFVEQMNRRAKELGMEDTNFVSCNGLDDDDVYNTTSAYDIAVMSRELMLKHSDIKQFTTIWIDSLRDGKFGLANTNKLIRFYEGATGLKTGSTSKAKNCLSATAERNGLKLIAVIMKAPTSKERFADASKLLNYGFGAYKMESVVKKGDVIASAEIKKGEQKTIDLVASENYSYLSEKNAKSKIEKKISAEACYEAPVKKDDIGGVLQIFSDDELIKEINLTFSKDVNRKKLFNIYSEVMLNWIGRKD